MRKLSYIFCGMILIIFSGCITSIHALYTQQDVIFDPALTGNWSAEKSPGEIWKFSKGEENEYILELMEKDGEKGLFSAHLLKLDGHLYLDLYPAMYDSTEMDFYHMHLLRVHSFLRIDQIEPTLKIAVINFRWLESFLTENPDAIRHELTDGRNVLTANTEELQAFIIKYQNTPGIFEEPNELIRR